MDLTFYNNLANIEFVLSLENELSDWMKTTFTSLTLSLFALSPSVGVAADFSKPENVSEDKVKVSAYLGAYYAQNYVEETDVSSSAGSHNASETRFDSGLSLALKGNTAIFSGSYRNTHLSSDEDFDSNEDPNWQYGIGLQLLRDLDNDTKLGFLVSYNDTISQDEDRSDEYDVLLVGLEFQKFLDENIFVGVQVGIGDKLREGDDNLEGFNNGLFGRFVGSYFITEHSLLTVDFELAGCENYVDQSDPGRFFGVGLNYQHQFKDDLPLTLIVYGEFEHYSSTDEGEQIDEVIFGIGFRYSFGAKSPYALTRSGASLGLPKLPGRAIAWTEWMD